MARKRVEAEVPDGTRLGFAQDSDGGMRGLLFDEETGKLVGHANLFEYDDYGDSNDDPPPERDQDVDVIVEVISQVLTNLLIYGAERAAPHVQNWWNDRAAPALKEKALPAIKSAPGRFRAAAKRTNRRRGSESRGSADVVMALSDTEPLGQVDERPVGIDALGPVMSSAEAQQRLARAVAAVAFAREQMRDLQNATIIDDGDPALAGLLNEITPQHLEEAIRMTLEVNPLMLDRPNLSALTIGQRPEGPQGDLVPVRRKDSLPLAKGKEESTT